MTNKTHGFGGAGVGRSCLLGLVTPSEDVICMLADQQLIRFVSAILRRFEIAAGTPPDPNRDWS